MDANALIPSPDVLPAPAWLLILLEQLLFLLHIVVINAILGGFIILLFRKLKSSGNLLTELHQPIAVRLPILFALGINFAVPPLLFIQVVYGNLFYTSSVLMAVYWILIIPLLILGYYGAYIHKSKLLTSPVAAKIILSAAVLIVLYIGFMLVNNNSLMEQPEKWNAYFNHRGGNILNIADKTIWPRYIHFITASIAVGGLFYAIVAKFLKSETKTKNQQIKKSLKIFAHATSIQVLIGIWYLLTIPKSFMLNFMGGNIGATIFLTLGFISAIAAIMFGFKGNFNFSIATILLTLVSMIITRFYLRTFYLQDNFQVSQLELKPQYGVFLLFIFILLAGIASIVYMLKISSTSNKRSIES